jgi:hypothetical protein
MLLSSIVTTTATTPIGLSRLITTWTQAPPSQFLKRTAQGILRKPSKPQSFWRRKRINTQKQKEWTDTQQNKIQETLQPVT